MIPFVTDTLGWRFLLAFVLSVTLWARLTLDQNPERRDIYPTEIPVEARGLSQKFVVANDLQPITVRIEELRESSVPVRVEQTGSLPFGFRPSGEPTVQPVAVKVSGPASAV